MSQLKITNLKSIPAGAPGWDRERLEFAIRGANRIFAHPRFNEEWLKARLTETTPDEEYIPLTNAQVFERIMAADQKNPLDEKGVADIQVVMYYGRFSRVVGYTYFSETRIWVNRKFWGAPKYVCSNLMHEYTHQLGFPHGGVWASSIPYTMNKIVEKLWDELCPDIEKDYWAWWYS